MDEGFIVGLLLLLEKDKGRNSTQFCKIKVGVL